MITININDGRIICPICQENGMKKIKAIGFHESYWKCFKCDIIFSWKHEGVRTEND